MRKNIYEFYFGRSFDSAEKIKDEGKLKGNKNASFCQKGSSAKILEFHSVKNFFLSAFSPRIFLVHCADML